MKLRKGSARRTIGYLGQVNVVQIKMYKMYLSCTRKNALVSPRQLPTQFSWAKTGSHCWTDNYGINNKSKLCPCAFVVIES